MIELGYTEDKLWNDRQIRKISSHHQYLTCVKDDLELALFTILNVIEDEIYKSFEDFKIDFDKIN